MAFAAPALAQVKQTREQMMFYTAQMEKASVSPMAVPRLPDDLLKRVVDVSVEDLWGLSARQGLQTASSTPATRCCMPKKPFAGPRPDGAVHAAAPRHV